MILPRVIPSLLLKGEGLVKGIGFKNYTYIGDPINAVKIFNDKEVDELLFLDILVTKEKRKLSIDLIQKIADECYMPFSVGGGIRSTEDIRMLLSAGVEKVCINSAALENPSFIREAADIFGNQSIIVSIDVKKKFGGIYSIFSHSDKRHSKIAPVEWAQEVEELGAGEILLTSVDRDGSMQGYDIELIKKITDAVNIPVIAGGGANSIEDLADAVHKGNASAVAAGSFFVFHGKRRAVLINFPTKNELQQIFNRNLKNNEDTC